MSSKKYEGRIIELQAQDGYSLKAIHYKNLVPNFKGRIVIAGATGVPQRFYRSFATFLCENGFDVWTVDYRGIGLSKPTTLKGFKMDYLDWAKLDCAALVDLVAADFDGPIFMIGHSYGGHAVGLMANSHRISKFAIFGTGAGWHGWMPKLEQLRVRFMWQILGPIIVKWKGYLAWSLLRMGEDLPKDVYRQWKHWCQFPHYFFDDPNMKGIETSFAKVTNPILAINATDDKWAPPQSRDAFVRAYVNSEVQIRNVQPTELGMGEIGHMNYFRPEAKKLWVETLDWIISGH